MRRLLIVALLGLAAPAAAEIVVQRWVPTPENEALYRQRFADLMRDKGVVTHYDPLEAVPGAAFRALPVAKHPTIRADALEAAAAYAAANNSNAFIVWRDGKIEAERYFGGTTATTPLVSKSLSKPVGAVAVGRAIALGKIKSVDQPAADFFPEWRGTPKAEILIRHLLDMRSGLLEQGFSEDPESPLNRAYIDPDHGQYILDRYPLVAPPGSVYGYANAPAQLIALLIERATGRRYAEFVSREVLKPIGAAGGTIWIDRPGGLAHSGSAMYLPAQSYLRLAILLLDDGVANGRRLMPRGFVADMRKGTPQNPHFGMGVWVGAPYIERRNFGGPSKPGGTLQSEPYLDPDLFLFDGNANQTVYVMPATRTIVLRTGENPPRSPEWDNAKLPNLIARGLGPGK